MHTDTHGYKRLSINAAVQNCLFMHTNTHSTQTRNMHRNFTYSYTLHIQLPYIHINTRIHTGTHTMYIY